MQDKEQFSNEYGFTAFRGQVVQATSKEEVHKDEIRIHGNSATRSKLSIFNHTLYIRLVSGGEKRVELYGDVIWRAGSDVVCYQAGGGAEPAKTIAIGNLDTGELSVSPRAWKVIPASPKFSGAVVIWLLYSVMVMQDTWFMASGHGSWWASWAIVLLAPVIIGIWSLFDTRQRSGKVYDTIRPHFERVKNEASMNKAG